jgi:hypothetical protein
MLLQRSVAALDDSYTAHEFKMQCADRISAINDKHLAILDERNKTKLLKWSASSLLVFWRDPKGVAKS